MLKADQKIVLIAKQTNESNSVLNQRVIIISFFLNTKFCPRYTLRTCSSAASSSAVPAFNIYPSKSKYALSVIESVS